jgi:hypothetical protein
MISFVLAGVSSLRHGGKLEILSVYGSILFLVYTGLLGRDDFDLDICNLSRVVPSVWQCEL